MHTPRRLAPKIIVVAVAAGLLALAAILFTPSPVPAAPTISWMPESVTQTILAGESATVPVSFTATENLTNVVVRVVPELAPYVQTNPTSFASIVQGQTVNLDLTISAPASLLPGTFNGTIQLRSGDDPKKTYATPLPVTLTTIAKLPLIGPPIARPDHIPENQPTIVTITTEVEITDTLIAENVNLIRYNQQGEVISDLGPMYDDGTHGDLLSEDGTFTTQITFNESGATTILLRTSAAYRGLLQRIQSENCVVFVQSARTPEEVLSDLVNDLRSGNIEAALEKFSTERQGNRDVLETISQSQLMRLADYFENAHLIKESEDHRTYKSLLIEEDNSQSEVQFTMLKNQLGQWKIHNW